MTVRELIEILLTCNQDSEVCIELNYIPTETVEPIVRITQNEESRTVILEV